MQRSSVKESGLTAGLEAVNWATQQARQTETPKRNNSPGAAAAELVYDSPPVGKRRHWLRPKLARTESYWWPKKRLSSYTKVKSTFALKNLP